MAYNFHTEVHFDIPQATLPAFVDVDVPLTLFEGVGKNTKDETGG
jgi:hypothetical protein